MTGIGTYQSGFPVQIFQSNNNSGLLGSGQRPNAVSGVDPGTSGSDIDRIGAWFNTAAWSLAAPFTLGDAPRTDGRVRTPLKKNWDIAVQKTQPLGATNLMVRLESDQCVRQPELPRSADRLRARELRSGHRSRRLPAPDAVDGAPRVVV